MANNPLKISDTTFRDGHQSLMATRFRMEDMEPLLADMDAIGFHSMEVWGGATFDVSTRFLGEDPWKRLRIFKKHLPNTPLSMLLRGQSLVGYRAYADDVVDAFVERSAEVGIDIFRVFDALNDKVNLYQAAKAVKKANKHLQMAICYSITEEGRLGGPIYNLDYYMERAKEFEALGADSICLKDMGGLLAPYDAFKLVTEIKKITKIPLQLHCHYTSGMASMSVLKAMEAGVDIVDTCLAPLALRTAQPAIEPLLVAAGGTDRDPSLDLDKILAIGDSLEAVLPKYRLYLETPRVAVIDAKVLKHQIPGGMASNLISQLREAGAIDKLDEVLEEIPRTRKDLGYPPLVTPMSQMTGSQAVNNVLFGRYKMITGQVRDYVAGAYGKQPGPIDPELIKLAMVDREPIMGRPADSIEPELEQAKEAIKSISGDIDDVLIYALYPTTGLRFLKIKHGLEPMPDEMKPDYVDPSQIVTSASALTEAPPRSPNARQFNVTVGGEHFQVEVDPVGGSSPLSGSPTTAAPGSASAAPAQPSEAPAVPAEPEVAAGDATILAPIPGIVLKYEVEVGQKVSAGDAVVVLEAMKMENSLPSPIDGVVKTLPAQPGETVAKDSVLAIIST